MLIIIFLTILYYIIEYIVALSINSFVIRFLTKIVLIVFLFIFFFKVIIILLIISFNFSVNLRLNRVSYRRFPLFFNHKFTLKFESLESLEKSRSILNVNIISYTFVELY